MAEVETVRSDADIEEEIDRIITRYPPLVHDRHFIDISVQQGVVTISGYVRTGITGAHLVNAIQAMPDVRSVKTSQFYSDDKIRLDVGQRIPAGIFSNVDRGVVILTGHLPEGSTEKKLVTAVGEIAGVRAVHAKFS